MIFKRKKIKNQKQNNQKQNNMSELTIGVDRKGNPVNIRLKELKHLLVGGSAGTGKTISVISMITSLITHFKSKDLKIMLFDTTKNDYSLFEKNPQLPHLLKPVVVDVEEMNKQVNELLKEIKRRFETFENYDVSDFEEYKKIMTTNDFAEYMPKIVLFIDDYADLKMNFPNINEVIEKIGKNGHKAGVHMILATQVTNEKVLTEKTLSVIPTRLSFTTLNEKDSKIVLGKKGAEQLKPRGQFILIKENDDVINGTSVYIHPDELKEIIVQDIADILDINVDKTIFNDDTKLRKQREQKAYKEVKHVDKIIRRYLRSITNANIKVTDISVSNNFMCLSYEINRNNSNNKVDINKLKEYAPNHLDKEIDELTYIRHDDHDTLEIILYLEIENRIPIDKKQLF